MREPQRALTDEQALARAKALRPRLIKQGYYLVGPDGQPWPEKEWCRPCAVAVAFHFRRRRGTRGIQPMECWSGDDGMRFCCGCGVLLDTGGLTSYGADAEFGHFAEHGARWSDTGDLILLLEAIDGERRPQVVAWLVEVVGDIPATEPQKGLRELLP